MAAVVDECDARRRAAAAAAAAAPPRAPAEASSGEVRFPFCCVAGDGFTSWYQRHHWEGMRKQAKAAAQAAQAAHQATAMATAAPAQEVS